MLISRRKDLLHGIPGKDARREPVRARQALRPRGAAEGTAAARVLVQVNRRSSSNSMLRATL